MSAPAIETVVRMMEALPEPAQDQLVEHLREYLADFTDSRSIIISAASAD